MKASDTVVAIVALFVSVGACYSSPPEVVVTSGTAIITNLSRVFINGAWDITFTITPDPSACIVEVRPYDSHDAIRSVRVEPNQYLTTGGNYLMTVTTVYARAKPASSGRLVRLEEVSPLSNDSTPNGELWIRATVNGTSTLTDGNIGGAGSQPLGMFRGNQILVIESLSLGGNVTAKIEAIGSLQGQDSNIQRIIASGSLLNDVTAIHGRLVEPLVMGGDIGTPADPVAITCKGDVREIAADSIYADINTTANGGTGRIWRLAATSGDFVGSLTTLDIDETDGSVSNPGLRVAGDLLADVTIVRDLHDPVVVGGDFPADKTFIVTDDVIDDGSTVEGRFQFGGAMAGTIKVGKVLGGTLTTGANGLAGQVIVNSAGGVPAGWWQKDAAIGSDVLSPRPDYAELESEIGGGAIGVAPFNFHATDCSPAHDATVHPAPSLARVRHYGPVFVNGSDMPVTVERRRYDPVGAWSDVSASYSASVSSVNPRDLIVTHNTSVFAARYEYRIKPVATRLKCSDVATSPDVAAYEYRFTVELDCTGCLDFSGDGKIDETDIALWEANPVDVDGDKLITDDDLLCILEVADA